MCMKEYHVFTFSNLAALKRVMRQLNLSKFNKKAIEGRVVVIEKWNSRPYPRNEYSFKTLETMRIKYAIMRTNTHEFKTHTELLDITLKLDEKADVFGIITVELR